MPRLIAALARPCPGAETFRSYVAFARGEACIILPDRRMGGENAVVQPGWAAR